MRGGQDRAADRDGTRTSQYELEAALCRSSQVPARFGDPAATDGASTEDAPGQEAVRAAQTNTRAGVRHHQIGDGIPPMSASWTRECQRRMESGGDELEHQAAVRPAAGMTRSGCTPLLD